MDRLSTTQRFNIREVIKRLSEKACPQYKFCFDDRQLMNVRADDAIFPLIFFEEYRQGFYSSHNFTFKTVTTELYFCRLVPMHDDADERENCREQIETEAVIPFLRTLNDAAFKQQSGIYFDNPDKVPFYTPPPRFDANEVSIMLRFDIKLIGC